MGKDYSLLCFADLGDLGYLVIRLNPTISDILVNCFFGHFGYLGYCGYLGMLFIWIILITKNYLCDLP